MTGPVPPPGSNSQRPFGPPDADEHAELARLRKENAELEKLHTSRRLWYPGQPIPPDAEPLREMIELGYAADVATEARAQQLRRDARRELDAQGWQPPAAAASLAAELALPRETYRYRIDGLAGWNHNVLVAGPRKVGKSQLMVNLAAALSLSAASGQPGQLLWSPGTFLGLAQCRMGGNVGYVNAEMDADDWRDCFRALPPGTFDPARIFPLHVRGRAFPVVTSPAARQWFTSWLREYQIEVLITDTWGQFCAANGVRNLNDDGEVRVITSGLDEIKAATWVASLFVLIHMPHQTGEKHVERFKGAGAVGDWADSLWTYAKDEEEIRYLWAEGRARISQPETALAYRHETGQLWLGTTGSRAQTARERQRARAVAALEQAGQGGLGTEDLKDAAGGNRKAAGEVIAELAAGGTAEVETRGRARIYRMRDYRRSDHQG